MSTICASTHDALAAVLFGQTRRAVLSLLFTRPDESFYLRQIVRLTGKAIGAVQRELADLADVGILSRERVGLHIMYRADPSCPVYQELKAMITKTSGVAGVLQACLSPLRDRLKCAFIFGSFARGEHVSSSDVDVMVVAETITLAELVAATRGVQQQLGREVNPILYKPAEFANKLRNGHHFLHRVMNAKKIALVGDLRELEAMAQKRLAQASSGVQQRNTRTTRRRGA